MPVANSGGKRLIDLAPESWVRWVLNDPTAVVEASLSGEFQYISRQSDSLLRVRGRAGEFLVHTEVQLRHDRRMPLRMRAYAALAQEKYELPVHAVVIYLLPPLDPAEIATRFHQEFMGQVAHQDFAVIKVWELNASAVLEQGITALMPFVPLMQGCDEEMVRQAAHTLEPEPDRLERQSILALFAGRALGAEVSQRMVRWSMDDLLQVIRESPWYEYFKKEEFKRGIQQGMERGVRDSTLGHLVLVLEDQFGAVPQTLADYLERLPTATLNNLFLTALSAPTLSVFQQQVDALLGRTN